MSKYFGLTLNHAYVCCFWTPGGIEVDNSKPNGITCSIAEHKLLKSILEISDSGETGERIHLAAILYISLTLCVESQQIKADNHHWNDLVDRKSKG